MSFHTQRKTFHVVGGGIIGLSVAHRLQRSFPDASVVVLEKEAQVGQHQSGHNSGVLHAGLYYKPGSLKAKLAVEGIRRMIAFCQEQGIPHETCGKLVVAVDDTELGRLKDLHERGQANGLRDLRWLSPAEMREIEPHVRGVAAVHVPEEGIVDYPAVCRALQALIEREGGKVLLKAPVTAIEADGLGWRITTPLGDQPTDFLFNCAGLHCDRILQMSGEIRTARIVPFRGEYYTLKPEAQSLVRHLVYPVPDPKFPFLGVHFTRMIHGGVEAGPNAVLAGAREGYTWKQVQAADLADSLLFGGFWRFLRRYPSMAFYEIRRSLSQREFCRSLQRLVPELEQRHLAPGGAGVRAQALGRDGTLMQDFDFVLRRNALHLINAPSPGATAALAIADHLIDQVRVATF